MVWKQAVDRIGLALFDVPSIQREHVMILGQVLFYYRIANIGIFNFKKRSVLSMNKSKSSQRSLKTIVEEHPVFVIGAFIMAALSLGFVSGKAFNQRDVTFAEKLKEEADSNLVKANAEKIEMKSLNVELESAIKTNELDIDGLRKENTLLNDAIEEKEAEISTLQKENKNSSTGNIAQTSTQLQTARSELSQKVTENRRLGLQVTNLETELSKAKLNLQDQTALAIKLANNVRWNAEQCLT